LRTNNSNMADADDTGAPLPALYARAEALHRQLEQSSLSSGSEEFQTLVSKGHRLLREAYRRAVSTGLFSRNEDGDDMHTNDIKYLLIPYYLGHFELRHSDPDERLAHLDASKRNFESFVRLAAQYGFITDEDKAEWEGKKAKSGDARVAREELMAREKRRRAALARLEELRQQRVKLSQKVGEEAAYNEDADEEEIDREIITTLIQVSVTDALREIKSSEEESEMLTMIAKMRMAGQSIAPPRPSIPKDPKPPIVIREGDLDRVDKRQELMAKMFQPGWIQPKYTVEQAGEMEMRHAVRGGGAASAPGGSDTHHGGQAKEDDGAEETSDADTDDDEDELRRKRDYDSWKDDHPTGSGNTIGQG